ncbi:zinc finger protein 711-like [Haematobia irritans]|uniref:zinc finger protein 711-like n=1 Tax=Haematobia irritans TaxID=7368 RepID=UPI003F501D42
MEIVYEEFLCRSCLVKLEIDTDFEVQDDTTKFVKISTSSDVQQLLDLCLRGQTSKVTYNLPNMCRECFEKWLDFARYYELLVKNNTRLEKILAQNLSNIVAEEEQANKIFIETSDDLMQIEKYETNSPFYEDNNSNDDSYHKVDDVPVECHLINNSPLLDVLGDETCPSRGHNDGDVMKISKLKIRHGRSNASMIKRKYRRRHVAKCCGTDSSIIFSGTKTKKPLYRCDPCKKYFFEINTYKGHIKMVHEGISKAYQCSHCGKGYKFYKNLTVHIAENHSDKRQEAPFCKLCNKEFKTQATLKNHMKIKHPSDESIIINRRAVCEQCGFIASSPESLAAHIKNKHTESESFKCELCPKVFKCRYTLKRHIVTLHSGIKLFQCPECGMTFSRRNGLSKHKSTHLSYNERIKCDFEGCDVRFSNNDAKKSHIQLVHLKVRQHICDICGEAFGIKATLRHHRYIHTGENPYKCGVCGQGFRQHTAMKTHEKTHKAKNSKYGKDNREIQKIGIYVDQFL